METREWFYGRVSTSHQNLSRQIAKFKELGADERQIITDKESGKDFNRQGYLALRNQLLRDGDTLTVCSLDRLGRNKAQIKDELEYFKKHNIRLKVLDIPTTLIDFPQGQEWVCEMVNNILIEVLATMAEAERTTIHMRQAEGIASAKKKGIKFGRPTIPLPVSWAEDYQKWKAGGITAVALYRDKYHMSRAGFYNKVREYEKKSKALI